MILLWASIALADTGDSGWSPLGAPIHGADADDDGWPDSVDCAVDDATIYPGAAELCNRIDDDCDGVIDDAVELCNLVDDDCDGEIDEDCPACQETDATPAVVLLLPLLWLGRRRRAT